MMKLRNKKTGEIVDLSEGFIQDTRNGESIIIKPLAISYKEGYLYNSLAELNEDWEDYTPAEPLIKDQKIRKAVRAWAEAFGVTNAYVVGIGDGKDYIELYAQDNGVTDGRIRMSISTRNDIWIDKEYTINELCGEEKE